MNRSKSILYFAVAALTLAIVGPVYSMEADFPDRVEEHGVVFILRGSGTLRFARLLRLYDAALYLPKGTTDDDLYADGLRLEVEYRITTRAHRLVDATYDILGDNFSPAEMATIEPRIKEINKLWRDFEPGERATLTYVPDRGTSLAINGEEQGVIEGEDFARMYFAIWLGQQPASERLKEQLLGESG